jgi:hypothetical protein
LLVILSFLAFSQPQPTAPIPGTPGEGRLKIFVLQGNGAINNVKSGLSTAPVVEVRDLNDRPLEGVTVTFEVPASGPGAFFPQGKFSLTTRTDANGQAGATGFAANPQTGKFNIKVTATLGSDSTTVEIAQTNSNTLFAIDSRKKSGISKKTWWIIAGVAAAGLTVGLVLSTRGGGSTSNPGVTITANPGPIVIGGPK